MNLTRRNVIKASLALAVCGMAPSFARASLPDTARKLHFYNTHTGESLAAVYWEKGEYNSEALKDIAYVLRDHRTQDMSPIDPHLLDILTDLHQRLGSSRPFEVISGYRSPRSNAMLHEHSNGVAVNSLHMYGQAIDIRLADRSLSHLRNAAWDMQRGGVGYYPASNFVHMDTGRVRRW